MLNVTIKLKEFFDDKTETFVYEEQSIVLEHSLLSLSKWESKFNKPFLGKDRKTTEESIYYIKCMTLTPDVPDNVYDCVTDQNIEAITNYIQAPMTATTFRNDSQKQTNREVITAEIIYYWMIALTIPFECQEWHLNRLLTLINVCSIKNQPPKKMNKKEIMSRNRTLNEARRAAYNTKG